MTGGAHTVPLDISVAAKAGLAEVNVALVEVLAGRGTVGGALAWATLLTAFLDLSCRDYKGKADHIKNTQSYSTNQLR